MQTGMRLAKPLPSAATLSNQITKNITKNLGPPLKKQVDLRNELVAHWQPRHRPKFTGEISVKGKTIILTIFVANSESRVPRSSATIGDLWTWWEYTGTKAHIIVPKDATVLRYQHKSKIRFSMRVQHPGTKAHEETVEPNKKFEKLIDSLVQKSIKAGIGG